VGVEAMAVMTSIPAIRFNQKLSNRIGKNMRLEIKQIKYNIVYN
jgi:hypothetical protein